MEVVGAIPAEIYRVGSAIAFDNGVGSAAVAVIAYEFEGQPFTPGVIRVGRKLKTAKTGGGNLVHEKSSLDNKANVEQRLRRGKTASNDESLSSKEERKKGRKEGEQKGRKEGRRAKRKEDEVANN
jgi:hypothetical protein